MKVDEFQKEIVRFMELWAKTKGIRFSEQSTFNHLIEEVGELAREFVNREIRKDKFCDEKFDNAIGDILVHLVVLAELRNIKIEQLIMDIIEKDKKRFLKE